jgi:CHAT domain-containing protein/tetratricopeptide (TPR) repeat protein
MTMRAYASATDRQEKHLRSRALQLLCIAWVACLSGCSGSFQAEPLVEYSTDVVVTGGKPPALVRYLAAGHYLVEIRERDVDLRVRVDAGGQRVELADAFRRHGLHRTVVSLDVPGRVRIELDSVDQRAWKGAAAVRILRWPTAAPGSTPDARLLAFRQLGEGARLIAGRTPDDWRAALEPLRDAGRLFQAAQDLQSAAEAEYQRAWVEVGLLADFEAGRKTAEAALAHFRAAGDEASARRTVLLLSMAQANDAADATPESSRLAKHGVPDATTGRVADALSWFESRELQSDVLAAMAWSASRELAAGRDTEASAASDALRRRARGRHDRYYEVIGTGQLAQLAFRRGDVARAAALYESVLPVIERADSPALHAELQSGLGSALTVFGDFERAQTLHTQALQVLASRGDERGMARELGALAGIQFRCGDVERALTTAESAIALYEHSRDAEGQAAAMRMAGEIASGLGRHALAVQYLRGAERRDRGGSSLARTRVLLAGELRMLGDLRGAEHLLEQAMLYGDAPTRANALSERGRLRIAQNRRIEALGDLRAADEAFSTLHLDFNRIHSSAELSFALLATGAIDAAGRAADLAVGIESRIRSKTVSPEARARLLSASYSPYEARVEVDLATGTDRNAATWRAFQTAERVRARSLADRLSRGGQWQRAGAPTAGIPAIADARPDVQAALPADAAVLAYFVGDRRSHAWLLTRTELRHAELPGRREIQDLVARFVEWRRAGAMSTPQLSFEKLSGGLLEGLDAQRLLILPDGPLHGLPFAALPLSDSRPRELLIDRFVISAAPSLAVALRPADKPAGAMRVAVISDPVYTPDDRRLTQATQGASRFRGAGEFSDRLARLPYSAIEARAVARSFDDANVIELAGFDATAQRVMRLPSRDLAVLHFATHAMVREDAPEESALFLSEFAPDGTTLSQDRLTTEDISRSGLRADVVVLSGCATGDGRELRGEGVLGLTYGFLANGSHTVIASLWPVEDALTARFMKEFYAAYRVSGRVNESLRTAQLRTRDSAGPTVWSSFVVRASTLQ